MQIRTSYPAELLQALDHWQGRFTEPRTLYHALEIHTGYWLGTFGDGENGAYEWFQWRQNGGLETSDKGYGSMDDALEQVLIRHAAESNWALATIQIVGELK